MSNIDKLEKKIGYTFKDKSLLLNALTHSSYANELKKPVTSNERLEFLGDSVLGIIIADYLYKNFKEKSEGELTKMRAMLVCEASLYKYACEISLGDYISLGKGEQNTGGRQRPSILADAFEALIAAIYLDSNLDTARKFVLTYAKKLIGKKHIFEDYKTRLQEIVQQNPGEKIQYVLSSQSGPDHNKRFTVEVRLNSNTLGKGTGRSKKDAEQKAAFEALRIMGMDK